jgi:DNA-binding response OmpR family regulator/signal transduction histidine kinase
MEGEKSFTILIVDDEKDILDFLSLLFQTQGYRVRTANTGIEGVSLAQDPNVDLVLLDVMLPDINGFDVCLKIKERRPRLPVINLTVRDQPIDIVTGLDSGADDYVTKPCPNPVLLARVRAALRASVTNNSDDRTPTAAENRNRLSDTLLAVVQPLRQLLRTEEVAKTIVERTRAVLDVQHSALVTWQAQAQGLDREHLSGSDAEIASLLQKLGREWDQALYNELHNQREPICSGESGAIPVTLRPFHIALGARATLVAPLLSQDQLSGALILLRHTQTAFSDDEIEVATAITCQVGLALELARILPSLDNAHKLNFEQAECTPQVLSIISHELRTPVAAIKGFITTLLSNYRYWDTHECEAFLRNVNESVDRLSRLIENVLEMGRIDKGLKLYKRPTSLVSLVQRVLDDLSFQSNPCEFVNEIPAHLPMLAIDPLRIERVLRNLLENSVKFSPQGGRIRVFARALENEIEVGIEDQGIGITAEHLPHIFERFYQVNHKDVAREGVGLGLSIVRELVHTHGGLVRAESRPGNGTTVFFTLPANGPTVRPQVLAPGAHPVVVDSKGRSHWMQHLPNGHPVVLIVEDDYQMLQFLHANLKKQGFGILTTPYGSKAIELIHTKRPHLVLLDLRLPDVDGLFVCEQVRRFSNIPIIIITAKTTECHKVRGLAVGADDYLTKPFSNEELVARVRAVLRRAQTPCNPKPPSRLRFDGLEIDPIRYEVKTSQGPIKLTPTEYKLLYYLASNAGHILTHQQLLTHIWGYECEDQTELLWVNVSRLRKKIEPHPEQPYYILNEPGIGYRFKEMAKVD